MPQALGSGLFFHSSQAQRISSTLMKVECRSKRISLAERNYDVGDRDLLAVKLALVALRHRLKGVEQPLVVWTDHKNLAYS